MPSPASPVAFEFGPLEVRWYALFILAGILVGVYIASKVARMRGQNETFLLDSVPIVVIAAVVGARLYFIALEWRFFSNNPGELASLQLRGLTIHGALAGGILTFWWLCRRHDEMFLRWADTVIVGVPIGQAIGRLGNWANQEAFGTPSMLPWSVEIAPSHRPQRYASDATFHPTFLYEALGSVAIAAILYAVLRRYGAQSGWRDGYALALYLVMYGIIRFAVESLRTDSLYIGPWPAAYWLSLALIVFGVALALLVRGKQTIDATA